MHTDAEQPAAPARSTRPRLPRAVLVLTAVWVATLLVWSVLLPTFRSADESRHVSAAYYLLETGSWPGFQQMPQLPWVIDATPPGDEGYQPLPAEVPAGTDSSFADRRDAPDAISEGPVNTIGQHPPLYYWLLAQAIQAAPQDATAAQTVWILRLGSIALLGPLPLLLAHGARRLGGGRAAVTTAAALPLAIPQLGALGGAVNNDNLLIAAAAATTVLCAHVLTGDLRYRTAALTGLALAVALLAKAFALVLLPLVVLAYLVAGQRYGRLLPALGGLGLAAGVAALGGWWWVGNLLRYGTLQPAGHSAPLANGPLGVLEALPGYFSEAAALIPMRFWATLSIRRGSEPPPFPFWLTTILFVLLIVALVAIPFLARRFELGVRAMDAAVLVLPFFASLALVIVGTWGLYRDTGLARGLQGRYLYVGLAGVLLVLALALSRMSRRSERFVSIVVTVAGLVFVAASMRMVLGFHWGYRDSAIADGVQTLRAWSPVPDLVLVLLAIAWCATAVWAVVEVRPRRAALVSGDLAAEDRATKDIAAEDLAAEEIATEETAAEPATAKDRSDPPRVRRRP